MTEAEALQSHLDAIESNVFAVYNALDRLEREQTTPQAVRDELSVQALKLGEAFNSVLLLKDAYGLPGRFQYMLRDRALLDSNKKEGQS